jgi:hypothetical protein
MPRSPLIVLILLPLAACLSGSPDRPISAATLSDEYERSRREVRSRYNGREIAVRGYVTLPPTMPQPGEDQGSVTLDEKERKVSHPGVCWFSKSQASAFSKIKGGQYVTVKGVFSGEGGANLKFCSLANIENGSD